MRGSRYRWSDQVLEPIDGLPFIGHNSMSKRVFVATGYSGTGMTFGTLAAMILQDAILARKNPFAELFSATRVKPVAGFTDYVTENVDFPVCFIADRLRPAEARVADIAPGQGKLVRVHGRKLAVYRDDRGELQRSRRCARTSVVTCASTTPKRRGTARVTARALHPMVGW